MRVLTVLILSDQRFMQLTGIEVKYPFDLPDANTVGIEPASVVDPESNADPVWHIDKILVFDTAAGHFCLKTVVHAGDVGSGIMGFASHGLFHGAAGTEEPVAYRQQRFPRFLPAGIIVMI